MSAKKAKAAKKAKVAKTAKTAKTVKKAKGPKKAAAKKKVAKKSLPAAKKARSAAASRPASSWFDEATSHPIIAEKAQQLESFMAAMADGVIDESELQAQEERLVRAMKKAEPTLDAQQHAVVTELLIELAAYDLMQVLHSFHKARPKTEFQG